MRVEFGDREPVTVSGHGRLHAGRVCGLRFTRDDTSDTYPRLSRTGTKNMEVLLLNALARMRLAFQRRCDSATPNSPNEDLRTEHAEFVRQFDTEGGRPLTSLAVRLQPFAAVMLASALGLFLEMAIVRWHSSCMHTFGVFKNVSMLSCFLGLGIGYAVAGQKRKPRLHVVLPLLALQCIAFAIISRTRLGRLSLNPVAEHYVMWQSGWRWWIEGLGGNLILAATFVVNAWMFIPLGQLAGQLMRPLPKLHGYALNLAGSLAGIGLFVALSALWAPPIVWMGIAVLGLVPFLSQGGESAVGDRVPAVSWRVFTGSLAILLLSFGIIDRAGVQNFYSPYQTITCQLGPDSKYPCVARLMVNQASFQRVLDLSPESQSRNSSLERIAQYYDLPHEIKPAARHVLVVGAGTGNDVAAALRAEAEEVTAVEIDPTILFLGERLHPERPYADQRVKTVNDDARTFLRRTTQQYDMIVYGLLDSHTTLGSTTNVRLDSFVYTVEGLREAAGRLSDDGLLTVTFAVMTPEQGKKLFLMLEQAFGNPPRCFEMGYDAGVMMVAGPAAQHVPSTIAGVKEITARFADPRLVAEVSTDDWPFFYMPRRTYPLTYAVMILILLAISATMIFRRVASTERGNSLFGPFFFLGAGFMLIETKAITQLGLVLGNTWQVLAVVVSAILVLAFLANLWIMWRGSVHRTTTFGLLGASLLVGVFVNLEVSAGWEIPAVNLTLLLVLTLPLFFSGLIFSSELARGGNLSNVLASNLFGAMLGGFLEYNSMYWGYGSLTWLGLAIYAIAFLSLQPPIKSWRETKSWWTKSWQTRSSATAPAT